MADLSPDDIAWLRRMFAGRAPQEIARMKALFVAQQALLLAERADLTAERAQSDAGETDGRTLLDVVDDLAHLRALFIALDMTFADLQDIDTRHALRTLSDHIHTRLQTIRDDVEELHESGRAADRAVRRSSGPNRDAAARPPAPAPG
ncbi:MAG: hypothetical protein JJU21_16850 [Salinarimonas sp.]|nr:hypothetical protein [Salinarimonas sp.]